MRWLSLFACRAELDTPTLAGAALVVLLAAAVAVNQQVARAAMANPVNALKRDYRYTETINGAAGCEDGVSPGRRTGVSRG